MYVKVITIYNNKTLNYITFKKKIIFTEIRQSHTTIAVVEKHLDGTYVLKALKQKLFVDGLCYLLQEIYGIENKNLDTKVVFFNCEFMKIMLT